ncbi:uncharacterized protein DEA37_0013871 [Paragonimus westermani]|uniref:Uncharacterized protein n=1 Tax=Paragonimus westermani TaxID=34504 RepID=A0A5J4ND42_9TREM|nr:uncharacterized protein DEA37_0013871 [Paragonimus westermani]
MLQLLLPLLLFVINLFINMNTICSVVTLFMMIF